MESDVAVMSSLSLSYTTIGNLSNRGAGLEPLLTSTKSINYTTETPMLHDLVHTNLDKQTKTSGDNLHLPEYTDDWRFGASRG